MPKLLFWSAVLASTVVGSLSAGFNEDFENFQSRHPGLQQCVQGVRDNVEVYPLEKWQGEQDTAIKLYGLFNLMGAEESKLAKRCSEFINASGYKNFPDPKQHSPQILAFSKAMSPLVEEIIKTQKSVFSRVESLYTDIASRSVNPDMVVMSLEWGLKILNRIDAMTENLVQKAATFVYEEPQPTSDEVQFNAFLESDMLMLQVLNKAKELYDARNPYNPQGYADAILAGYALENAEWRVKSELRTKILSILEDNFG